MCLDMKETVVRISCSGARSVFPLPIRHGDKLRLETGDLQRSEPGVWKDSRLERDLLCTFKRHQWLIG